MNRSHQLIQKMADDMSIQQGKSETDTQYKMRVLYSALGRLAYASLWDTLEEIEHKEVPVSEIHFKHRILSLIQVFHKVFPELKSLFFPDAKDGSQMIYDLFLNCEMYHSPYRLIPAVSASAEAVNVCFLRGTDPLVPGPVSGVGRYTLKAETPECVQSVAHMFLFAEQHPVAIWEHLCAQAKWSEAMHPEQLRFLRTKPPFSRGYWQEKTEQGITLARTQNNEMPIYYLCQSEGDRLLISQLPSWRTEEGAYRLLSAGIMLKQKTLPPILFHIDGGLVKIHVQYLLPPNEQRFLEFYSWPNSFTSDECSFHRICSTSIFTAIMKVLMEAGYYFAEE